MNLPTQVDIRRTISIFLSPHDESSIPLLVYGVTRLRIVLLTDFAAHWYRPNLDIFTYWKEGENACWRGYFKGCKNFAGGTSRAWKWYEPYGGKVRVVFDCRNLVPARLIALYSCTRVLQLAHVYGKLVLGAKRFL